MPIRELSDEQKTELSAGGVDPQEYVFDDATGEAVKRGANIDRPTSFAASVKKGFKSSLGSSLEGLPRAALTMVQKPQVAGVIGGNPLAQVAAQTANLLLPKEITAARGAEANTLATENPVFKRGTQMIDEAAQVSVNPETTTVNRVGESLGGAGPAILASLAPGIGIPLSIYQISTARGAQAAREAIEKGHPEMAQEAFEKSGGISLAANAATMGLASKLRPITGAIPTRIAGTSARSGALFGAQAAVENPAQNIAAQDFDPERSVVKNWGEDVLGAGLFGAGFGAGHAGISAAGRKLGLNFGPEEGGSPSGGGGTTTKGMYKGRLANANNWPEASAILNEVQQKFPGEDMSRWWNIIPANAKFDGPTLKSMLDSGDINKLVKGHPTLPILARYKEAGAPLQGSDYDFAAQMTSNPRGLEEYLAKQYGAITTGQAESIAQEEALAAQSMSAAARQKALRDAAVKRQQDAIVAAAQGKQKAAEELNKNELKLEKRATKGLSAAQAETAAKAQADEAQRAAIVRASMEQFDKQNPASPIKIKKQPVIGAQELLSAEEAAQQGGETLPPEEPPAPTGPTVPKTPPKPVIPGQAASTVIPESNATLQAQANEVANPNSPKQAALLTSPGQALKIGKFEIVWEDDGVKILNNEKANAEPKASTAEQVGIVKTPEAPTPAKTGAETQVVQVKRGAEPIIEQATTAQAAQEVAKAQAQVNPEATVEVKPADVAMEERARKAQEAADKIIAEREEKARLKNAALKFNEKLSKAPKISKPEAVPLAPPETPTAARPKKGTKVMPEPLTPEEQAIEQARLQAELEGETVPTAARPAKAPKRVKTSGMFITEDKNTGLYKVRKPDGSLVDALEVDSAVRAYEEAIKKGYVISGVIDANGNQIPAEQLKKASTTATTPNHVPPAPEGGKTPDFVPPKPPAPVTPNNPPPPTAARPEPKAPEPIPDHKILQIRKRSDGWEYKIKADKSENAWQFAPDEESARKSQGRFSYRAVELLSPKAESPAKQSAEQGGAKPFKKVNYKNIEAFGKDERVREAWSEGGADEDGYWITLKDGFANTEPGVPSQTIHEWSLESLNNRLNTVKRVSDLPPDQQQYYQKEYGVPNALQKQPTTEVLQRQPKETGGAGSERGGVQPSVEGTEAAGKGAAEVPNSGAEKALTPKEFMEKQIAEAEAAREKVREELLVETNQAAASAYPKSKLIKLADRAVKERIFTADEMTELRRLQYDKDTNADMLGERIQDMLRRGAKTPEAPKGPSFGEKLIDLAAKLPGAGKSLGIASDTGRLYEDILGTIGDRFAKSPVASVFRSTVGQLKDRSNPISNEAGRQLETFKDNVTRESNKRAEEGYRLLKGYNIQDIERVGLTQAEDYRHEPRTYDLTPKQEELLGNLKELFVRWGEEESKRAGWVNENGTFRPKTLKPGYVYDALSRRALKVLTNIKGHPEEIAKMKKQFEASMRRQGFNDDRIDAEWENLTDPRGVFAPENSTFEALRKPEGYKYPVEWLAPLPERIAKYALKSGADIAFHENVETNPLLATSRNHFEDGRGGTVAKDARELDDFTKDAVRRAITTDARMLTAEIRYADRFTRIFNSLTVQTPQTINDVIQSWHRIGGNTGILNAIRGYVEGPFHAERLSKLGFVRRGPSFKQDIIKGKHAGDDFVGGMEGAVDSFSKVTLNESLQRFIQLAAARAAELKVAQALESGDSRFFRRIGEPQWQDKAPSELAETLTTRIIKEATSAGDITDTPDWLIVGSNNPVRYPVSLMRWAFGQTNRQIDHTLKPFLRGDFAPMVHLLAGGLASAYLVDKVKELLWKAKPRDASWEEWIKLGSPEKVRFVANKLAGANAGGAMVALVSQALNGASGMQAYAPRNTALQAAQNVMERVGQLAAEARKRGELNGEMLGDFIETTAKDNVSLIRAVTREPDEKGIREKRLFEHYTGKKDEDTSSLNNPFSLGTKFRKAETQEETDRRAEEIYTAARKNPNYPLPSIRGQLANDPEYYRFLGKIKGTNAAQEEAMKANQEDLTTTAYKRFQIKRISESLPRKESLEASPRGPMIKQKKR